MTMIELDFEVITRPVPRASGRYVVDVPDGWQQGRGAFGGLVIAALVRAIEHAAASPDRSLRTLTATLPGATLVGAAEIEVELVRVGSGQTTAAARLTQHGELMAMVTAVLAKARAPDAESFTALPAPAMRDSDDMPVIPSRPPFPTFTRHVEYRSDGPFPLAGGSEALAAGWVRFQRPFAVGQPGAAMTPGAYLAALIDAWWPANLARMRSFRPMATVGFGLQICQSPAPLDAGVPLAYRGRSVSQHEGWMVEERELWHPDGRLLALNQQAIAIIR